MSSRNCARRAVTLSPLTETSPCPGRATLKVPQLRPGAEGARVAQRCVGNFPQVIEEACPKGNRHGGAALVSRLAGVVLVVLPASRSGGSSKPRPDPTPAGVSTWLCPGR